MFSVLGVDVTEMELSLTVKSCTLTGKGILTYSGVQYDVEVTLAVFDIDLGPECSDHFIDQTAVTLMLNNCTMEIQ